MGWRGGQRGKEKRKEGSLSFQCNKSCESNKCCRFSPEGTSFPQLLLKMMLPLCTWEMLFIFAEYPDDMLDWLLADLGPFADLNDAVPAIPHNTPHIVHSHGDVPVQQMTAHVEQVAD